MIKIIVVLENILVLIYHLYGFSSDILKYHELLTICNLIYNTRLKEAEKSSNFWRQDFAETVCFFTCVLDTVVFFKCIYS